MASRSLQTGIMSVAALRHFPWRSKIEQWLEVERDQLALWAPVMFGIGIAAWFALPNPLAWSGFLVMTLGLCLVGMLIGKDLRAGRALIVSGLLMALGCLLIWGKSLWVTAPVLERPVVEQFEARVERVDMIAARDRYRLIVSPVGRDDLPPRFRVNVRPNDMPTAVTPGAVIKLRARLMPPAPPSLPGGYDFSKRAWFDRIGATGTALGPVSVVKEGAKSSGLRARLSAHIKTQLHGGEGAIAAALATGDQTGISDDDAEAMRRSGLAHLLSISGLHVTAVVGFAMWMLMKLLALSPKLALRWNLPLAAAGGGALAGIGYTLLTGAEVPTMRSCIAALLVLGGFALGREAITLRLVATGALIVLFFWPEALVGPSFQLSFAAVTAIVAFHQSGLAKRWFARREEGWVKRSVRNIVALLMTGLVVELALIPISLLHFHKAGLYGALANIIAIPLSTFVVMPLEALALLFDSIGLGAPFWWLAGKALGGLLALAHWVAGLPGAVTMFPSLPISAFLLMLGGGMWLLLWQTSARFWGIPFIATGAVLALSASPPDLLVSGDGRHIAARGSDGTVALLRERAGDYSRDMLAESAGVDGELADLSAMDGVRCTKDFCVWTMADSDNPTVGWTILASRSGQMVDPGLLIEACNQVDIVISDRRLPRRCTPRWLKLDKPQLTETGGLAISLSRPIIINAVKDPARGHPWNDPPTVAPPSKWPVRKPIAASELRVLQY